MELEQHAGMIAGVIAVLSVFVEFSKIKINPISMLLGWIGKKLTAPLEKKIERNQKDTIMRLEQIEEKQDCLEKKIEEVSMQELLDATDSIKTRIFSFYHELQKSSIHHSEAEFNAIIALNAKYEKLVEKTRQQNGVYTAEYEYIMQVYRQRQKDNYFGTRDRNIERDREG